MKARLDRAFGDGKFMDVLGDTSVEHVQLAKSDHCALMINVKPFVANQQPGSHPLKPFRCEDMWFRHDGYK